MSNYKMSPGPRGRKLYFKTNEQGKFKMISVNSIPKDILATMELQESVDDTKPEFRKCIFCGELATEQKKITGQNVDLCFDDYHNRTTGEVVEKLRENHEGNA